MKVIALGGAGDMCSFAVRDLVRQDDVAQIMIADYDGDKASALARELGTKCTSMQVDADRASELVRAVKGYDVAVGGIGPFYKYEHKVAKACIDAGVPYVSICDDYDAAEAVLKLDGHAKKAKVTILTGLGWTPGLSNVLARLGADQLDDVEEIAVAWGGSASDSEGYAVILHTIHIFTGFVPSFQHGRRKMVQAGGDRERVLFPEPVGEIYVYDLGHPEPVTIPRFLNVKNVTLKGGLSEEELNQVARYLARARLTSTVRRKDIMGKTVKALSPVLFKLGQPETPCSAIRVDVTGMKGGAWTHLTYGAADHMNALTGLPLSIGAQMIGRGLIDRPGVQAPESCVDPALFLAELTARDVKVFEGEAFENRIN